jgi:hypothetical protein
MELDSCHSDLEESHPTTVYNPPPTDLEDASLNSASISSPPQNCDHTLQNHPTPSYDNTLQNHDIPQCLKALVKLQTKTNHLLTIQAASDDRFKQDVLSRIDNLTPRIDQIIELAATNTSNDHLPSSCSGSRRFAAFENAQPTPPGGRFAVSPVIMINCELILGAEV